MSTIAISETVNQTLSAYAIIALVRSDTSQPPVGVDLPISLSVAGMTWSGSFTDTAPPPTYLATAQITLANGAAQTFGLQIVGGGGAVGTYTSQALIEQTGQLDADVWSNIGNSGTGPNQSRFQSAINSVEAIIDGRFQDEFYSTPIPPTCPQFARLSEIATKLALVELYFAPRGIRDGDAVGGQLANLREWAFAELDRILSRPLGGVNVTGSGVTRNFPSPCSLVASDWRGNPRPMVSNRANPNLPGWFFGCGGLPWGLW